MSLALLLLYLMLNMFRMLIHPSSGAYGLCAELFHGLYCSASMCVGVTLWFGCGGVVSICRLRHQCLSLHMDTTSNQSNTTHEITQHISRKLLRMAVLTSETCWALNKEIIKQMTSSWSRFTQLVSPLCLQKGDESINKLLEDLITIIPRQALRSIQYLVQWGKGPALATCLKIRLRMNLIFTPSYSFLAWCLTPVAAFTLPDTQRLLDSIQVVMSITATCRLTELRLCPLPNTTSAAGNLWTCYQHYTN